MNRRKNTHEFREDKVVHQIYLHTKQNQYLHSRLANLLYTRKINHHIAAGYESRMTDFFKNCAIDFFNIAKESRSFSKKQETVEKIMSYIFCI